MTDSYIGVPPQSGFITTAKQRVTSSTNNYVDLDHSISSLADVIVWVNFVKQDSTNLSLTTSTRITLGATLVASDIVEIAYLGKAVATQTPDTGTVTNDMLAGSIANSKLATDPLNASNLASGTVPTARLGSGTASSSTVLYGDGTFKAEPSGSWELLDTKNTTSGATVDLTYNSDNGFQSTYHTHVIMFDSIRTVVDNDVIKLMSFDTSDNTQQIYYAFEYIDTNESGSTTNPNASGTASSSPHQVNLFGDVGSGFNEGASGIMYFTGADDGGMANLFWGTVQVFTHDNKYRLHQIMGRIANNQIKKLRFYGGGGNWESGHIRLYGIK